MADDNKRWQDMNARRAGGPDPPDQWGGKRAAIPHSGSRRGGEGFAGETETLTFVI